MFDLRKSHAHPATFDLVSIGLGLLGLGFAVLTWRWGGGWLILCAVAVFCLCLLIYGMLLGPRRLAVRDYSVSLAGASAVRLKLIFLSDFHAGGFRSKEWYERIVNETNALHPDILVLGGDFVCDRHEGMVQLEVLRRLEAPRKFFVLGNHDFMDRPDLVRQAVAQFGVEDLTNKKILIEKDGRKLELGGVDSLWFGAPQLPRRTSKDTPFILISHEPDILMDMKEGDADLVVCGHTHGGQVRFPYLGYPWPIPAKLGNAVDRGRKTIFGIPTIISEGLGEFNTRARLFTRPEISVIEIRI
ncbi:MAG: metallophosphoesterase [Patescibacteria group bacterium]